MPTYIVAVAERRTYEIEAADEAAAIDRALGDPGRSRGRTEPWG